jgi:hypothetical protein
MRSLCGVMRSEDTRKKVGVVNIVEEIAEN